MRLLPILLVFCVSGAVALEPEVQQVTPDSMLLARSGGDLMHTEWRFTDSAGQAFGLHRYRRSGGGNLASLFYLPGTNMNGRVEPGTAHHNLWLYLAARGVEVFTLDYRTRHVAHDTSGNLEFMRDWTMDRFVADAEIAVTHVQGLSDGPLFIAGFSRGVSYAYALAGRQQFAGLVALDGSFKTQPYRPFDLGSALRQYDEQAIYATTLSRRGYTWREALMRDAIDDPDGAAADQRFESAADYLSETLYSAWGPGVLTNTRDGVSSLDLLAREMLGYDWFFPSIQDIEGRSIRLQEDDPASTLDDHFGEMSLPILYFGSGRFGADALIAGIHSAGRSGSRDVTIHVLENYGHLDVLFAREAPDAVYSVILDWIRQRVAGSP